MQGIGGALFGREYIKTKETARADFSLQLVASRITLVSSRGNRDLSEQRPATHVLTGLLKNIRLCLTIPSNSSSQSDLGFHSCNLRSVTGRLFGDSAPVGDSVNPTSGRVDDDCMGVALEGGESKGVTFSPKGLDRRG